MAAATPCLHGPEKRVSTYFPAPVPLEERAARGLTRDYALVLV